MSAAAPRVQVTCPACGEPIRSRRELLVVGRVLTPVHAGCGARFRAAQPWYLRSWPLNRWGPLLAFNGLLLGLVGVGALLRPGLPLRPALLILGIANGWLLIGRLVAWYSIERHLPES